MNTPYQIEPAPQSALEHALTQIATSKPKKFAKLIVAMEQTGGHITELYFLAERSGGSIDTLEDLLLWTRIAATSASNLLADPDEVQSTQPEQISELLFHEEILWLAVFKLQSLLN